MPRFLVRFRGSVAPPEADLNQIRNLPGLRVIDGASSRMMLVDVSEHHLRAAIDAMSGWIMLPERAVHVPDPRKKTSNSPPADED